MTHQTSFGERPCSAFGLGKIFGGFRNVFSRPCSFAFSCFSPVSFVDQPHANAASFQLTWADNSTNEDGFIIERKTGTSGIFARIASVGANVTVYTDSSLADAMRYCYHVNAFNSAANSAYSPELCGTTPAQPIATFSLMVSSQGNGTITSTPAGINCGTGCFTAFTSGTTVTLKAVPVSGYSFSGWTGDADCLDGTITMNANKTCTAFSQVRAVQTPKLTVSVIAMATAAGTGKGIVTSNPAEITCSATCSANFTSGDSVILIPSPSPGSVFSGWSGDADCSDGVVTMISSKSCGATLYPRDIC